jgi:hypothetical protein
VRGPIIKWNYASRDDELEAIRWYLVGRLDPQTKLKSQLGTAVNAFEYLRHAIELPARGEFLQVPMKRTGARAWLFADPETGRWLKTPEFPRLLSQSYLLTPEKLSWTALTPNIRPSTPRTLLSWRIGECSRR